MQSVTQIGLTTADNLPRRRTHPRDPNETRPRGARIGERICRPDLGPRPDPVRRTGPRHPSPPASPIEALVNLSRLSCRHRCRRTLCHGPCAVAHCAWCGLSALLAHIKLIVALGPPKRPILLGNVSRRAHHDSTQVLVSPHALLPLTPRLSCRLMRRVR